MPFEVIRVDDVVEARSGSLETLRTIMSRTHIAETIANIAISTKFRIVT